MCQGTSRHESSIEHSTFGYGLSSACEPAPGATRMDQKVRSTYQLALGGNPKPISGRIGNGADHSSLQNVGVGIRVVVVSIGVVSIVVVSIGVGVVSVGVRVNLIGVIMFAVSTLTISMSIPNPIPTPSPVGILITVSISNTSSIGVLVTVVISSIVVSIDAAAVVTVVVRRAIDGNRLLRLWRRHSLLRRLVLLLFLILVLVLVLVVAALLLALARKPLVQRLPVRRSRRRRHYGQDGRVLVPVEVQVKVPTAAIAAIGGDRAFKPRAKFFVGIVTRGSSAGGGRSGRGLLLVGHGDRKARIVLILYYAY